MATPGTRRRSSIAWLFLSFRGRVSRRVYWLTYGYLYSVNFALLFLLLGHEEGALFHLAQAVVPFVILGTFYVQISLSVKRLHDVGYSGFLAVASLIPFVNLVFIIWIGLPPGTSGANLYGDVTDAPPA